MNVLFYKTWDACYNDVKAFVITHLLTGEEDEKDPWCVLFLENVTSEEDVCHQLANGDSTSYKMCFVHTLPFYYERPVHQQLAVVVCF